MRALTNQIADIFSPNDKARYRCKNKNMTESIPSKKSMQIETLKMHFLRHYMLRLNF